MDTLTERRAELRDFLRTRRARLTPEAVGLPNGSRRRTPGLRREEVALLANIGSTWYTRLEQGLPINVSAEVLDAIARALRLTRDERKHLYVLAGQPLAWTSASEDEVVGEIVQRVLDALEPFPAIVRGRRFDVLAWNGATLRFFTDYSKARGNERNILWRFFIAGYSCDMRDRDGAARKLVAQFRSVAAKYADDPSFAELIEELREHSNEFRKLWARHDVLDLVDGVKIYDHPLVGEVYLDHTTLLVPGQSDMRMTVYTAAAGSASERKLRELALLAVA
jgi:transcriptional regulator with XRE-family HTH domain